MVLRGAKENSGTVLRDVANNMLCPFLVKGAVELVSLFFFLAFEVGKGSVVWCVHVFLRFTKNGCSWLWCSPSYLRHHAMFVACSKRGPFEAECCPTRAEALTELDGLCEKLLEKHIGLVMTYHQLHLQTPRFSRQSLNRTLFGLLFCINSRVLTTMTMRIKVMLMALVVVKVIVHYHFDRHGRATVRKIQPGETRELEYRKVVSICPCEATIDHQFLGHV